MLLATWNLRHEWAHSPQGLAQTDRIATVAAEVWILTEASPGSVPQTHNAAPSARMPGVDSGACFAVVSAVNLEPIMLPEVPTAAAAVAQTGSGKWLIVGICMPWRKDAPTLPPDAAPGKKSGPEQWLHVLDQLDRAVERLTKEKPGLPLAIR